MGHLRPAEDGDAPDRAFHDLAEELPVRREKLLGEVPRHAVDRPGHGLPLEAADQEPAHLLAEVDEVLRIAEAGCPARQLVAGNRLRGQVLVDERRDRQAHARHRGDLAAPHAGRVDHDLRAHPAAIRDHRRHRAVPGPLDARHADAGLDRHSEGAGAPRQLGRRPARVDPPVPRQVHGAVKVIGGHERKQPERLGGRDGVHVEAERARGADLPPQEEPLVAARGHPETPDLVPVLGGARFGLEAPVETDRVLPHPHDRRRRVEVRDHPRGVPGRPARELALVEEQHVGPALLRQVVGDAAAGDAAADDDDPRLVSHWPPRAPSRADDRSILPMRPRPVNAGATQQ